MNEPSGPTDVVGAATVVAVVDVVAPTVVVGDELVVGATVELVTIDVEVPRTVAEQAASSKVVAISAIGIFLYT